MSAQWPIFLNNIQQRLCGHVVAVVGVEELGREGVQKVSLVKVCVGGRRPTCHHLARPGISCERQKLHQVEPTSQHKPQRVANP